MSTAAPDLSGRRLLLVRPRPVNAANGDDPFAAAIRAAGGQVRTLASTGFAPPRDPRPLQAARRRLAEGGAYDWAVFTSPRAVAACAQPDGAAPRPWPGLKVAAVGQATARLLRATGHEVHLCPPGQTAAGLAQAMAALGAELAGARILLPQGNRAKAGLARALVDLGARVESVQAYRTEALDLSDADLATLDGPLDAVIYTSGSGAQALLEGLEARGRRGHELAAGRPVIALGPRTAADLRALGLRVDGVAARPDAGGLLEALRQAFDSIR